MPDPKLEREFPEFKYGCIYCEMVFECQDSMRRHQDYWHIMEKKEEEKE